VSAEPVRRSSLVPAVSQIAEADGARGSRRAGFAGGTPTQRDRLVMAMGELIAEFGGAAVGVHHVCQRAGISRRTFYDLYVDRDTCLRDTLAEAQVRLVGCVTEAVGGVGPEWEDRAVAATRALVGALCADRVLGYLCVVAPLAAGRDALALRSATMDETGRLLGDPPSVQPATDIVLSAALGGVWELLRRHLSEEAPQGDLQAAATYGLLAPFVGRRRAVIRASALGHSTTFVARWTPSDVGTEDLGLLVTELTRQTLEYLDRHPDATNVAVARAVDVRHESQMSRHLARLRREGVVERRREGRTNAWRLTARGRDAVRSVRDQRCVASVAPVAEATTTKSITFTRGGTR
jgi:AcrR family transcriptional regulator